MFALLDGGGWRSRWFFLIIDSGVVGVLEEFGDGLAGGRQSVWLLFQCSLDVLHFLEHVAVVGGRSGDGGQSI